MSSVVWTERRKAGVRGALWFVSLFRNLYRDFLHESLTIVPDKYLQRAWEAFQEIAKQWKQVAELIEKSGVSGDSKFLDQASDVLTELSALEKQAMELLLKVTSAGNQAMTPHIQT